jgi:hypothetical protein
MPLFRVRRERCIPYDVIVEAPTMYDAEQAADADFDKWSDGCAYWQELETDELEDGDDDPAIVVPDPAPVVHDPDSRCPARS